MTKAVKKVLLIIPPAYTFKHNIDVNPLPPLGLAYLGAVLEREGIETKIVDCLVEGWESRAEAGKNLMRIGLPFEELELIIREYAPDVVGVNSLFTRQRENAHNVYALAKKVSPEITTIAGGAHATVMPELVLSDPNVDFVVLGEGESTIIDLVRVIEGKKEAAELDGVAFREQGAVRIIPKTTFIQDLDSLPFPARHLLNMERYFGLRASHGRRKKQRFSPIITSRGCPARCTFCSAHRVWGRKYRYRSAENVIAEMRELKERYGIEELMFEDDNFNLNMARAEQIFDGMIRERFGFVWDTPNGVSAYALNEGLLDKMKESGCSNLNLAIETGNQDVMDRIIRKPVKLDRIQPLVEYARSIGLDVGVFLVIGMPGETEEQMWDSFRLARRLGIYLPHISIATPYPGSELFDLCMEKGYLAEGFSLDDLYIRSFSISTPGWSNARLRQIYRKGKRYLLFSFLRDAPVRFLKEMAGRLLAEPTTFLRRASTFLAR